MRSTENERDSGQESDHEKNSGNPVPGTSIPNERKRQAVAVNMDEQTKRIKMMVDTIGEMRVMVRDALTQMEQLTSRIGGVQGPPQLLPNSIVSAPSNNETTLMEITSGDAQPTQEHGTNGEREEATRSPIGHISRHSRTTLLISPSGSRVNNLSTLRDSHLLTPRAGNRNVESNAAIHRFVIDMRHTPGTITIGPTHYHFHI